MRRLKQIWAWYRTDKVQRAVALGAIAAGGAGAKMLWADAHKRLDALEERGLVPIDDLATVGDLGKLEGRMLKVETASAYVDPQPPGAAG